MSKNTDEIRRAAQILGSIGGKRNTPAQIAARARNAKLGGWPKGRPRKPRITSPSDLEAAGRDLFNQAGILKDV